MDNKITSIIADKRFSVIFDDPGNWRVGIYKPEFDNADDVDKFEKHSCPELFICLNGKMGLVTKSEKGESVHQLEPNQCIMVTDYHNGFNIDAEGYFMVVERTEFNTEYIDR